MSAAMWKSVLGQVWRSWLSLPAIGKILSVGGVLIGLSLLHMQYQIWANGGEIETPPQLQQTPSTASSPSRQLAPGNYTIKGDRVAATSPEALQEAIRYANQRDEVAFSQMFTQGRLVRLIEGQTVYLEGCEGFACSTIKIRPQGSTQTFYTVTEAIE